MKFGKTLVLTTLLTAGAVFALGTDAHAAESYTVQSGDTLSKISVKFAGDNSLIDSIAKENNISNIHMIFEGQTLTIDTDAEGTATTAVQEQTAAVQTTTQETAPVQQAEQQTTQAATQTTTQATTAETATSTNSAKEWIAQRESSGSYTATNGQYIGRYQLSASYLNGDYSAENQERVADQYVTSRYGSWEGAQAFWQANGWY
ncbi:aggregation-promoting factor [Enterococcus pingfangensis]|uniref:aggregation-promoting factor n=1 Tax=Enterococcus pingfangensis TaxID=2559924 RepID=UPI0010F8AEB9|nr:LysM domain-containing protein [Enterococcus pingfangensis]